MHFNVSQLIREAGGAFRAHEVDEAIPLQADPERQRVWGVVKLLRTDKGVWVSAELETEAPSVCSRCLHEYDQPVYIVIEEEFFSAADPGTRSGLGAGEESYRIDHNHVLDLSEAVRQYATLSAPMKLTCREDCKGICSSCGSDLNETVCRCDSEVRDSRWGPLLDLVSSPGSVLSTKADAPPPKEETLKRTPRRSLCPLRNPAAFRL